MKSVLKFFGLSLNRDLDAMEQRARKAEMYASTVTEQAGKDGAIVVGGDGSVIENIRLSEGRSILIPIGVRNVIVRNVKIEHRS